MHFNYLEVRIFPIIIDIVKHRGSRGGVKSTQGERQRSQASHSTVDRYYEGTVFISASSYEQRFSFVLVHSPFGGHKRFCCVTFPVI